MDSAIEAQISNTIDGELINIPKDRSIARLKSNQYHPYRLLYEKVLFVFDDNIHRLILNDDRGVTLYPTTNTDMFKMNPQSTIKLMVSAIIPSSYRIDTYLFAKRHNNEVEFLLSPITKNDLLTENPFVSSMERYLREIDRQGNISNNAVPFLALETFNKDNTTGEYQRCIIFFLLLGDNDFEAMNLSDKLFNIVNPKSYNITELINPYYSELVRCNFNTRHRSVKDVHIVPEDIIFVMNEAKLELE